VAVLGCLLLLASLATPALAWAARELTVAAAADLTFPFAELVPAFERRHGVKVTFVFGSTGTLAKQIEHGAPMDVFFAADQAFVEKLVARGLLIRETQTLYARGRIALATVRRTGLKLAGLQDLTRPEVKRIAIANPTHAPYGRAAEQALQKSGLWETLRPKLVYGENVRQALQFLQTGNVEAGILALSVAHVPEITYVLLDGSLHVPLNQVAAVVGRSREPELGLAFIRFVAGGEGRTVMKRFGFLLPGEW